MLKVLCYYHNARTGRGSWITPSNLRFVSAETEAQKKKRLACFLGLRRVEQTSYARITDEETEARADPR